MKNKGYMFRLKNAEPSSAPITKIQKGVPFVLCRNREDIFYRNETTDAANNKLYFALRFDDSNYSTV